MRKPTLPRLTFGPLRKRTPSVLDMPESEYDPATHLPARMQVGKYLVKPLVGVQDVLDHLDLLHAFHDLTQGSENSHRIYDNAAMQYETWAQTVLPFQLQKRERLRGTASAPMSRRGTGDSASAVLVEGDESPLSPTYIPAEEMGVEGILTPDGSTVESPVELGERGRVVSSPTTLVNPSWPAVSSPLGPTGATGANGATPTPPATTTSPHTLARGHSHAGHSHHTSHEYYIDLTPEELPPLSVLMCWHAHLLNSAQYAADTSRGTYAALSRVKFPLHAAAEACRSPSPSLPAHLPHIPEGSQLRVIPSISGWTVADVSAAVQRQSVVVDSVNKLGWFGAHFADDKRPFQRAIVRYHAWLDLVAHVGRHQHLVPDTDIELVWRTHELKGERYRRATEKLLGAPFDERVSRTDKTGLKRTQHLWRERYHCEYLLPGSPRRNQSPSRMPQRRSTLP